jgi:hypothetical protein
MNRESEVRVVLPADPPELLPRGARILLDILLDAWERGGAASVPAGTIPPQDQREEVAGG